jgi:hypothetical protein
MFKAHHYENFHILLWLIKDACWMLHWKVLGITMIPPTVIVAIIIAIKSRKEKSDSFWVNLAVFFWISGNSYWMLCEFSNHEEIKNYAGFPFLAGMISVGYFYLKPLFIKKTNDV